MFKKSVVLEKFILPIKHSTQGTELKLDLLLLKEYLLKAIIPFNREKCYMSTYLRQKSGKFLCF